MKNDLDQFWIEVQLWFAGVYAQWDALPSDRRVAIGFGAICLCSLLLVFFYKRKLHRTQDAVARLEAVNQLGQQCTHDMAPSANPLHPYGDGIVEKPAYSETIEVEGGLNEEFFLEVISRMDSIHATTLETVKALVADFNRATTASTHQVTQSLVNQFTKMLDKIAQQQSNSNKMLLDTVDHITTAQQTTHEQTMETMQRLVKCVEHVLEEPDDRYEEDEE